MKTLTKLLTVVSACVISAGIGVAAQRANRQAKAPPAARVNINSATAEEFAGLPGVGPELARRIVEFRTKHGPFRRVEDLLAIRGIGQKKWKAMRPYLTVGSRNSEGRKQPLRL